MSPEELPTPDAAAQTVDSGTLQDRIDAGEDVTLLDAHTFQARGVEYRR